MSGDAIARGCPALSPVNEGSNAIVKNPISANVCAYSPETCSLTAPNGPAHAIAGNFSLTPFGLYKSATSNIPYLFLNVTFL